MKKLTAYPKEHENEMRNLYNSLTEKDRRRYAAVEARKLGYGGIRYVCRVLECDEGTIKHGMMELKTQLQPHDGRIRKKGAGRKRVLDTEEGIDEAFLEIMSPHTAGSPMDESIKWSNLSRKSIADELGKHGFTVSETVVDQLLEEHNFRRRKAFKSVVGKQVAQRDEQFKNIERIVKQAQAKENPVMSMDVKKKELIGNFYRDGEIYTQERVHVNDHDFRSQADGVAIPHALYDMRRNIGYITIGTSRDTTEFACACIQSWWLTYGRIEYPNATELTLLCDCGGSNNARYYIFKQDLQELADKIGLPIRIAHYPPYTSKYNPVEHRLFPHVTRACKGVIFKNVDIVKEFIGKTKTTTGLKVFTSVLEDVFETKRKVADDFKETMRIRFDDYLPKWNYVAIPATLEL